MGGMGVAVGAGVGCPGADVGEGCGDGSCACTSFETNGKYVIVGAPGASPSATAFDTVASTRLATTDKPTIDLQGMRSLIALKRPPLPHKLSFYVRLGVFDALPLVATLTINI